MSRQSKRISAWPMTPWIGSAACLGVALLLALPPQLRAATEMSCAGVSLPTKERAFNVDLVLNGMGIRSWGLFNIQAYVAGLYLERRTKNASDVLPRERTKLMVFAYLRDADRERMIEMIREGIDGQPAQIKKLVQKNLPDLERRLPDPRKGRRLTFAYGQGRLELRQNGKVLGSWDDPALAEAMFTLWLGAKPVDSDLKKGLLGGACD